MSADIRLSLLPGTQIRKWGPFCFAAYVLTHDVVGDGERGSMSPYRYVVEILDEKRRKPAPVQIGCSHPAAIDITSLAELSVWPPHSLLLCNSCGARWCRPRHAVT